ncbi:MAG: alpha/beta fold hydrolase [Pseudohongiellaceae bacterium]
MILYRIPMPFSLSRLAWLALAVLLSGTAAYAERQPSDDERFVDDPRVQHLSYTFPQTGESIPYALFVPESYREGVEAPFIVSLHGLGRGYDWLMGYNGFLDYAEAGGYIVATPLGYTRRGWFGSRETEDPTDAQYSEQDVMNVIARVRTEFAVDDNRIYLWGHSMGGAGTYHIGINNPDLFAGLAVAAPAPRRDLDPQALEAIVDVPVLVIHGDDDQTVPVEQSRQWVAKMRELGMQHIYIEIPGGDHSLIVSQNRENMKKIVDFFNIVRKQ